MNDGENDCNINCEMEGSVASLRVKLKNNEELERVKRLLILPSKIIFQKKFSIWTVDAETTKQPNVAELIAEQFLNIVPDEPNCLKQKMGVI